MNTLLTTVFSPEANISSKAPERRTQPESKQSEENSFAGALAHQIQPQQNNSSTPTTQQESNTVTPKGNPEPNNTQTTSNKETNAAQTAAKPVNSSDAGVQTASKGRQNAQPSNISNQAIDKPMLLASNLLTPTTEQSSTIEKHELPQRFQQIIASLQQTRSADSAKPQTNTKNTQIVLPQATETKGSEQSSIQWQHQSKLEPAAKSAALANDLAQTKHNATGQDFKRGAAVTEARTFNTTPENPDKLVNSANFALNSHSLNAQAHTEANSNNVSSVATAQSIMAAAAPISELSNNPAALNGAISKPVFSANWGADMSRQVVSMIRAGTNGSHIAELRLDPPELGPLRVTINLNDNVIQAVFSSAHASVRNAVEQALPQLQQQLQQEGLSLGEANVGQENNPQHTQDQQKFASLGISPESTNKGSPLPNEAAVNRQASDALIDTFA